MATKPKKNHPWKQHNHDTKADRIARGEQPVSSLPAPLSYAKGAGRAPLVGRIR